ncbi:hypothetical protein SAMN05444166_7714 [Singulisphaera sp. GP187]|nr:hypothetical protein SAMN05444166_7714 [Singulisphaera sp. GP187]
MDTCQEPRSRCVPRLDPGLSWYQDFPCGRKATTWHRGRPMCRGCRSEALRAEAWHRRATEGGVLGRLVNAAPNLVIWGFFLLSGIVCRDLLWESLHSEQGQLYAWFVFVAVVWGTIRAADHWLVRAWRRRRKGEKDGHGETGQEVTLE